MFDAIEFSSHEQQRNLYIYLFFIFQIRPMTNYCFYLNQLPSKVLVQKEKTI